MRSLFSLTVPCIDERVKHDQETFLLRVVWVNLFVLQSLNYTYAGTRRRSFPRQCAIYAEAWPSSCSANYAEG